MFPPFVQRSQPALAGHIIAKHCSCYTHLSHLLAYRAGGGLDSAAPKQFSYCRQQLAGYADPQRGAYWQEVKLAASDAMSVFGFPDPSMRTTSRRRRLLQGQVRRLDEVQSATKQPTAPSSWCVSRRLLTAIRSLRAQQPSHETYSSASWLQSQVSLTRKLPEPITAAGAKGIHIHRQLLEPPTPDRSKVVVFDIDETLLSNMQQILDPEHWPWDKWVEAAQAPPLEPVQQFYNALCEAGFSVAFVTGRREAGRAKTMQNLAAAGYGAPCADQTGLSSISSSSNSNTSSTECCYAALYMRPQNDTRLASVYKPWARQKLLSSMNLQLVALVGDQFSDLNGDVSAPYAFKLPNPFYYIL